MQRLLSYSHNLAYSSHAPLTNNAVPGLFQPPKPTESLMQFSRLQEVNRCAPLAFAARGCSVGQQLFGLCMQRHCHCHSCCE